MDPWKPEIPKAEGEPPASAFTEYADADDEFDYELEDEEDEDEEDDEDEDEVVDTDVEDDEDDDFDSDDEDDALANLHIIYDAGLRLLDPEGMPAESGQVPAASPRASVDEARVKSRFSDAFETRYGVKLWDGRHRSWSTTDAHVLAMALTHALKYIPPDVIDGVVMIRDKEFPQGAWHVEAATHFKKYGKKCLSYRGTHLHFYGDAFAPATPKISRIFGPDAGAHRAVVHEIGHLMLGLRARQAKSSLRRSQIETENAQHELNVAWDALKEELESATSAPVSPNQGNKWQRDASDLLSLVREAASCCRDLEYPPRPHMMGVDRMELLELARSHTLDTAPYFDRLKVAVRELGLIVARTSHRSEALLRFDQAMRTYNQAARRYMVNAARLADAYRTVDYFAHLAAVAGFRPFTDYAKKDHEEWFCETYALAVLVPQSAFLPDELREWIHRGCPAPRHLAYFEPPSANRQ